MVRPGPSQGRRVAERRHLKRAISEPHRARRRRQWSAWSCPSSGVHGSARRSFELLGHERRMRRRLVAGVDPSAFPLIDRGYEAVALAELAAWPASRRRDLGGQRIASGFRLPPRSESSSFIPEYGVLPNPHRGRPSVECPTAPYRRGAAKAGGRGARPGRRHGCHERHRRRLRRAVPNLP